MSAIEGWARNITSRSGAGCWIATKEVAFSALCLPLVKEPWFVRAYDLVAFENSGRKRY